MKSKKKQHGEMKGMKMFVHCTSALEIAKNDFV